MFKFHRMIKSSIALLVFVLVVSLVAACSGTSNPNTSNSSGNKDANKSNSSTNTAKPTEEPVEVTVSLWGVAESLSEPETDKLLQFVQKENNIVFKPQGVTWNDYKEKFNLWAASGELPDLFLTDFRLENTVDEWISQGLIRALPEDMSPYPYLQEIMQGPDVEPLQRDGQYYFIPRLTKLSIDEWALERGFVVRKDWMDKLNIETPTTFEEYLAMFKAFAEQDPDGNNKNDTIGMTHNFIDILNTAIKLGTDVPNLGASGWMKEDGQWIPAFASKGMVSFVDQYQQLYQSGAMDQDFSLLKVDDGIDKFAQGNVGALAIQGYADSLNKIKSRWDQYEHDVELEDIITFLPPWEAPDGNRYRFTSSTAYSDLYFSSKLSDEKMDAILRFLNYNLSPEGKDLYSYGFEGEDYKIENDEIIPLREKVVYPSQDFFNFTNGLGHSMNISRQVKAASVPEKLVELSFGQHDWMLENTKQVPVNFEIDFLSTPAKKKLTSITFFDDVIRIVLSGEDPQTAWDKQIKMYESQGLTDAINEVNEIAKERGIE